jgi:hypothetical protein
VKRSREPMRYCPPMPLSNTIFLNLRPLHDSSFMVKQHMTKHSVNGSNMCACTYTHCVQHQTSSSYACVCLLRSAAPAACHQTLHTPQQACMKKTSSIAIESNRACHSNSSNARDCMYNATVLQLHIYNAVCVLQTQVSGTY